MHSIQLLRQYLDVVMPLNNLKEYSNGYAETLRSLWKYYGNIPNDNTKNSESFKRKMGITGRASSDGNTMDVEMAVLLKCL